LGTGYGSDRTLTTRGIVFQVTYWVLAETAGGHGSVSPSLQAVADGATATFDIVPEPGYRIAAIRDNGVPQRVANPYLIYGVTRGHRVVVAFSPE
jgi:hypothetical protein